MGRNRDNTVKYFPMYCEPSNTLEILESKYGNDGFVFFHKLLRVLGSQDGHYYDARNLHDRELLAHKLTLPLDEVLKMIGDLCAWGKIDSCLWNTYKTIWYQGFVDTLDTAYNNRKRATPTILDVCNNLSISTVEIKPSEGAGDNNYCRNDSGHGVLPVKVPILHDMTGIKEKENISKSSNDIEKTNTEKPDRALDPQTYTEARSYRDRILQVIYNNWKKDLKGTFHDFRLCFFALPDFDYSDNDLGEMMYAFMNYIGSDKVKDDGMWMRITKWLPEWRNYIPEHELEYCDDFADDVKQFEEMNKKKGVKK